MIPTARAERAVISSAFIVVLLFFKHCRVIDKALCKESIRLGRFGCCRVLEELICRLELSRVCGRFGKEKAEESNCPFRLGSHIIPP